MVLRNPVIRVLLTGILATSTTVLIGWLIWHGMYGRISEPHPVTGPMKNGGWAFTVVAMDGGRPVRLVHEWSGGLRRYMAAAASAKQSREETIAKMGKGMRRATVFADTGRAQRPLRYYLSPADVEKACSQLRSAELDAYWNVKVEVSNNDPIRKSQTVRVLDQDDRDDIVSIYRVEDERVRPIAWSRCRPEVIGLLLLPLCPLVVVVSAATWWRVLGRKLSRQNIDHSEGC